MEVKETEGEILLLPTCERLRKAPGYRQGKVCEKLGKEVNSLPWFPGDSSFLFSYYAE